MKAALIVSLGILGCLSLAPRAAPRVPQERPPLLVDVVPVSSPCEAVADPCGPLTPVPELLLIERRVRPVGQVFAAVGDDPPAPPEDAVTIVGPATPIAAGAAFFVTLPAASDGPDLYVAPSVIVPDGAAPPAILPGQPGSVVYLFAPATAGVYTFAADWQVSLDKAQGRDRHGVKRLVVTVTAPMPPPGPTPTPVPSPQPTPTPVPDNSAVDPALVIKFVAALAADPPADQEQARTLAAVYLESAKALAVDATGTMTVGDLYAKTFNASVLAGVPRRDAALGNVRGVIDGLGAFPTATVLSGAEKDRFVGLWNRIGASLAEAAK